VIEKQSKIMNKNKIKLLVLMILILLGLGIFMLIKNQNKIFCKKIKSGFVECSCKSDTSFTAYFLNKKSGKEELHFLINENSEYYREWKFVPSNAILEKTKFINKLNKSFFTMDFSPSGNFLLSTKVPPYNTNEWYTRKFKENGEVEYVTHQYLPNLKLSYKSFYFTTNIKGDTLPNYFYYTYDKEHKKYKLITDNILFLLENPLMDSLNIMYTENNVNDVEFYTPKRGRYLIDFTGLKTKDISNSLTVTFEQDTNVIADLWCFFNKKNKYPYSNRTLVFSGDMLSRISKYSKEADKFEEEYRFGEINSVPILKSKLSQIGVTEVDGKVIISKELRRAINEAVNSKTDL
jgi:hypothetical protein